MSGPPGSGHPTARPRKGWTLLRGGFAIVYATAVFAAGWWIAQQVFARTGRPPELAAFLISIAVALLLAACAAWVVGRITGRYRDDPDLIWNDLGDALDRIARGDFTVRLRQPRGGVLADIVASVNNMAAGLGTVEHQRQEFVSNVSHEIHSPLTSISGFAALLRDPGLDESTRQHYVDIICAECDRLSGLSDNLLRLSALDDPVLNRTRYRLDEQVRDVILTLEPQWSSKGVEIDLDADPVEVDADADLLRQVWVNLVQNAVKFTAAGGSIHVRVSSGPHGRAVEVADTGIGIAPGDVPHVFERFFRADKARGVGGNGLGLALAKRIVEVHEGTIAVSSTLGVGTTFTVRLADLSRSAR